MVIHIGLKLNFLSGAGNRQPVSGYDRLTDEALSTRCQTP
jgi:hypothetical protein